MVVFEYLRKRGRRLELGFGFGGDESMPAQEYLDGKVFLEAMLATLVMTMREYL
jgi:hypothetical protein